MTLPLLNWEVWDFRVPVSDNVAVTLACRWLSFLFTILHCSVFQKPHIARKGKGIEITNCENLLISGSYGKYLEIQTHCAANLISRLSQLIYVSGKCSSCRDLATLTRDKSFKSCRGMILVIDAYFDLPCPTEQFTATYCKRRAWS